jgi:non-heme chloroperoxidase
LSINFLDVQYPAMSHPVQSHTVEVNRCKLNYRESGAGEPLVLLHGHVSDQRAWLDLEPLLATRFHVYNYSRRYAWPNEPIRDDERCPWEQDALDLAALIETLGIGPVHMLANSSGAVISLYAAKTKPHLFRTLMVEEPPVAGIFLPKIPPSLPAVLSFLIWHPITFWPVMTFAATTLVTVIDLCKTGQYDEANERFCRDVINHTYWPRLLRDPDRKQQVDDNAKWLCQFFRYSTMPEYVADDARRLKVPTLVMFGQDSCAHQRYTAMELFRLIGADRKEMRTIENAAHMMHEDNPEQVFKNVVEFVFDKAAK